MRTVGWLLPLPIRARAWGLPTGTDFQEFTRLPGAQGKEGFGLGLSIVRMLVQLLRGDNRCDSVPGKGSTFTLRVPLFPVRMPERTGEKCRKREEKPLPVPSSPSLRVLLIDDDSIQLTLTAAMLQHSGITSVSCMQPDELLDALRSGLLTYCSPMCRCRR